MRPARWNSRSPKKLSGDYVPTDNGVVPDGKTSEVGKMDNFPDGLAVKRNARVVPLSGDEGMSHPEGMSSGGAPERNGPESYRDYVHVPPRDVTGEVFGLNDTAVLTPAIAVAASLAVFAAPTDLAGWEFRPLPRIYLWPRMLGGGGGLPLIIRVSCRGGSPD